MNGHHLLNWRRGAALCITPLAAAVLVACGGGGGGTSSSATVAGTAATGAAIASGSVTLKCVSGTTSAVTTGTDGSFTVDVSGVTLPCLARVDYKDASGTAQKLHSYVGATGTANITPVTDLVVSKLAAGASTTAFDTFDASKVKALTAAQVQTAIAAVRTYLAELGVDITNFPADPLGSKFTPAVGSTAGDKADKVLDELAAKLKAAGKKLSEAGDDVAAGRSGKPGGGGSASITGSFAGQAPYAAVTAANNKLFIDNLPLACKLDPEFTDGDHVVYRNCKQDGTDLKTNLTMNLYLGALPAASSNTGSVVNSGPGATGKAAITWAQEVTDVAVGNSCEVTIVEPVIPIVSIKVKGAAYSGQMKLGNFSFNGTTDDYVYVDPKGGVAMLVGMTDGKGNKLLLSIDTRTGETGASIGPFNNDGTGASIMCGMVKS